MNVVFESGLRHLGVSPRTLETVPAYVRRVLAEVPVAWDETRFLGGWPGEWVVLARRKGGRWWIGGINGTDAPRSVEVDLRTLTGAAGTPGERLLVTDGEDLLSFRRETLPAAESVLRLEMRGRGGFVAIVPAGGG